MVYSTRRFVLCLTLCHFVLVFFSPFSIAITSLGEERANLSAFRTFVRFVLVWICRFPLPLGVWEGLRFAVCDFGTPCTFLLPCFAYFFNSGGHRDQWSKMILNSFVRRVTHGLFLRNYFQICLAF